MGWLELTMIAVGLSMDAFAVSLGKGLHMNRLNLRAALTIALFFGGFQALMPLLGWLLGQQFAQYITAVGHWIAFGLLAFIGGQMIVKAWKDKHEEESCGTVLRLRELLILAIATSIDALVVGISFSALSVSIAGAVLQIGLITFVLSLIGVSIGCRFGSKLKDKAEVLGGAVLLFIGVKILLEHLDIFA